ncbi:ABC transporter permease [Nocardioides litoris]|uniref:ABC transporter permease n=1 Tax=Nocardioides litoris TaxID=1926648 RepID=UPI00112063C6|nr:ABC transporter permease [Nocardioides litoris]
MSAAMLAEVRKLLTTRLWWILLLVMAGYVAFLGGVLGFAITTDPGGNADVVLPAGADAATTVYSVVNGAGYVFPLIIGSLMMTTEFRHKTVTESLLVEPRRSVFLGAKLLVAVPVGLVFGLVAVLAVVAAGSPLLAARGDGAFLGDGDVLASLLLAAVVIAVWAVIGVAFGSLVTNQVAAIVIILAFTQFVEPIARTVGGAVDALAPVAQYLPGAAADAVIGASFFSGFGGGSVDLLPRWAGLLVLIGYAVVLAALARVTTLRRDLL